MQKRTVARSKDDSSCPSNSVSINEVPRRIKSDSNSIEESLTYSDVSSSNHYLVPNGFKASRSDSSRKSFRSLLRSLSANATCSQDAQSILAGEPRPTDIAPADHASMFSARSHRRFAHSRNPSDVRHLARKKSHESSDNDDVFYTMPLSGSGKRRHSLGAYFVKDRQGVPTKNLLKVTSVPSEVPKTEAPKATTDGSPVCSSSSPIKSNKKSHPITTLHCDDPPLPISTISTTSPQKKKRSRCPSTKGNIWNR